MVTYETRSYEKSPTEQDTSPAGMRRVECTVKWVERWWHQSDHQPPGSSPDSHPNPANNTWKTRENIIHINIIKYQSFSRFSCVTCIWHSTVTIVLNTHNDCWHLFTTSASDYRCPSLENGIKLKLKQKQTWNYFETDIKAAFKTEIEQLSHCAISVLKAALISPSK